MLALQLGSSTLLGKVTEMMRSVMQTRSTSQFSSMAWIKLKLLQKSENDQTTSVYSKSLAFFGVQRRQFTIFTIVLCLIVNDITKSPCFFRRTPHLKHVSAEQSIKHISDVQYGLNKIQRGKIDRRDKQKRYENILHSICGAVQTKENNLVTGEMQVCQG